MKKFLISTVLAATLVATLPAQNIKARQKNQQSRIAQGVASGELTKRETRKLEKDQVKLAKEIHKDRRDGGGLTTRERAKIHVKQDKQSVKIAKQKHDRQDRN